MVLSSRDYLVALYYYNPKNIHFKPIIFKTYHKNKIAPRNMNKTPRINIKNFGKDIENFKWLAIYALSNFAPISRLTLYNRVYAPR